MIAVRSSKRPLYSRDDGILTVLDSLTEPHSGYSRLFMRIAASFSLIGTKATSRFASSALTAETMAFMESSVSVSPSCTGRWKPEEAARHRYGSACGRRRIS